MFTPSKAAARPRILYSCSTSHSREGEQLVPEHLSSYQVAGTLRLRNSTRSYAMPEGTFRFLRRNQLVEFEKQPSAANDFEALSVAFDQPTLRAVSLEYGCQATRQPPGAAALVLPAHPLCQ